MTPFSAVVSFAHAALTVVTPAGFAGASPVELRA